jgi:transposase, IS6 family
VKYLNNRIEADHGPIKRLCRATLGFKSMKTAYATIKGFEVMRMIRKRQCIRLCCINGGRTESGSLRSRD